MTSNEGIDAVVDKLVVEADDGTPIIRDIEALKQGLMTRDEEVMHALRMAANDQGLQPSITQYTLVSCGLGPKLDDDEIALLMSQCHQEMETLNAQAAEFRRRMEGG